MNGARYIPDQKAWLLPTDGAECEVLVAGKRAAPDAARLALTNYDGLSIHTERDVRVHQKAARFAQELGAKIFEI